MARVMNHCHRDFLRVTSFSSTRETFGVAYSDMGRHVIDSVGELLWNVVLSGRLVEKVSEWILIKHDQSGETTAMGHTNHN